MGRDKIKGRAPAASESDHARTSGAAEPIESPGEGEGRRRLRLEWIEAGTLAENPANWRRHPEGQMTALRDVLNDPEIGFAGAALFNERTGRLIDGHARRKAVSPDTPIPVLVGSWSPEAERKILATLDPLAALAVPDEDKLQSLLAEVDLGNSQALKGLLEQLAPNIETAESELDGDGASGKPKHGAESMGNDGKVKVKVVLCVEDLRSVESAILATGNNCRGEALADVCRDYLARKSGLPAAL